jgi:hypothetical protein
MLFLGTESCRYEKLARLVISEEIISANFASVQQLLFLSIAWELWAIVQQDNCARNLG